MDVAVGDSALPAGGAIDRLIPWLERTAGVVPTTVARR